MEIQGFLLKILYIILDCLSSKTQEHKLRDVIVYKAILNSLQRFKFIK